MCHQRVKSRLQALCRLSSAGHCVDQDNGSGLLNPITKTTATWYALAGFAYLTEFLERVQLGLGQPLPRAEREAAPHGRIWNAHQLMQAGHRLCAMPWWISVVIPTISIP